MEQGIDAFGLISGAALLAVVAGLFLGRLEHIIESSRRRLEIHQPARLRAKSASHRR